MQVTRKSLVSGITRTRDLPITLEQVAAFEAGALLQRAFPNLSDSDREFFKTGITDEEWDKTFPEEEYEGALADDEAAF